MGQYWQDISEFPDYMINQEGEVINNITDRKKYPSKNQQGIVMVNLIRDGKQFVRSLAVLVANEFTDRDKFPEHFDTVIHLDGNKENCNALNLSWRPRWFAVRYHRQFYIDKNYYEFKSRIIDLETEEIYDSVWEIAKTFGLLYDELFLSIANNEKVYPGPRQFQLLDDRKEFDRQFA